MCYFEPHAVAQKLRAFSSTKNSGTALLILSKNLVKRHSGADVLPFSRKALNKKTSEKGKLKNLQAILPITNDRLTVERSSVFLQLPIQNEKVFNLLFQQVNLFFFVLFIFPGLLCYLAKIVLVP